MDTRDTCGLFCCPPICGGPDVDHQDGCGEIESGVPGGEVVEHVLRSIRTSEPGGYRTVSIPRDGRRGLNVGRLPEQWCSPRRIMRPPRRADAPAMFDGRAAAGPTVTRVFGWGPHACGTQTRDFIDRWGAEWRAGANGGSG